jgi:hypothetical protein
LEKHGVVFVDLLNKSEFQFCYKKQDTKGRFSTKPKLDTRKVGRETWTMGKILRDKGLPYSFGNACLLNCIAFVDTHCQEQSLTKAREVRGLSVQIKMRCPVKKERAQEMQKLKLASIAFHAIKDVTHSEFDFFNICRESPIDTLYCSDCQT